MTAIDLVDTDTERQFRDSLRTFLRRRSDSVSVTAAYDRPTDFAALWRSLATELGLASLLVPESLGGAGATMREVAVAAQELGRAVAPVPFLTSAVVSTVVLAQLQCDEFLARLVSANAVAAVAIPFTTYRFTDPPTVTSQPTGLAGTVSTVAGLDNADIVIVPVSTPAGLELHAVTPGPGVTVARITSLDMSRPVSDLVLDRAPSVRLGAGTTGDVVRSALRAGTIALANEQVGVAGWCLDAVLEYVRQRHQFGRPIGSFQAIKHRLADLWVELNQAEAAARYAAAVADDDHEADIAASVAAAYCGSVAVHAAEECLQLHGGIGMTWEHPIHLYLKRAKADELAYGNPYQHRTWLADLIDLPLT
jgi:alkylation response protein AidB-like acyl-CoA dehydrogenase